MNKNEFTTIDTQYTNEQEQQSFTSIFTSRRNFMEWFRSFFDRSLLIYQLFYFAYYAAFGSLFPLISIYFKQLGLNALQCGILSGIRSLVECFAAPFWTALADKWKKGKMFVLISLVFTMAFTLGLGFVRPTPEGCLVSLPRSSKYNTTTIGDDEDGLILSIIQPYKASRYDDIKSIDMDRDLALKIRNQLGQSPLYLNTKLLVSPPKMKATRWGTGVGQQTGDQNLYARTQAYHDPTQFPPGSLVMPLYSTVVYGQTKINQIFIVILLLVLFSELMSCAAIPIVDAAVLQQSGIDFCNNYEKQRIFGSIGWALSMFFVGLTLDHSTSFPDYPCLHPGYREKNYMVCFATYSVFIACALFIATQFTFHYEGDSESMYFKLVKDKMARTFLGRTTKSRSKLVNEDDDVSDDGNSKDWKPDTLTTEVTTAKITTGTKSKQSNEEILEQQLGIKIVPKNTDGSMLKSQYTIDAQQEELAAAAQLKVTRWFSALKQFRQPRLLVFLFVIWFMGLGLGQVFTFLFWHMQELNGSPTLFGIASVINHMSEIFMYQFSKQIIDKIGHLKVLYLGLVGNVARFLYVSWITNPWWILPFEFIQGLTHAGVWVACCSYIMQAFQPEFRSSTLGFLRAIHYGMGRGLGAIFGGLVISSYGTPAMFRAYGAASALVLLSFLLLNYFMPIPAVSEESNDDKMYGHISTDELNTNSGQFGK
ncbi:Major facilitator superfamily domain-containing protein isoform 1 [Schistosoma japonicum]|uniref:Major facilitator superfamily domain-containing protein isoform 1 n=1 Tax=Schistosoma japonicum TaxID=6182 RepID=A0A4Z2D4T9_SCHJA|nr:Major facilitator superfamily domain-containing protein isoform 1 [Schistosoma japonicum]